MYLQALPKEEGGVAGDRHPHGASGGKRLLAKGGLA
jgi:hypothetical protein